MRTLAVKKEIAAALAFALATLLLLFPQYPASAAGPAASGFAINEDAGRGYITAENENLKVVWHYATRPDERSNRGGGNIYELYDKRTDPTASHNLVGVYNYGGSETTPNMAGIGGLGATHMWELGRSVSASDNARYSRLVSKDYYLDDQGNAVFRAAFIVKSSLLQYASDESTRPDNYRVDKKWTVYPSGQVKLDISMQILRDIVVAEPAYDFSFSQDYGFTTASSLGHKWNRDCGGVDSSGTSNPKNFLQTFNGIDSSPDYDNQLLHSEFFSLYGRPGGSTVRVKMDNNGKGFENGGLFGLGARVWGNVENPTVEYSNYRDEAYGHTLRYFAWWGGGPPPERRHKELTQGTSWSDSVWIEVIPASEPRSPQVQPLNQVEQPGYGSVAVNWWTDIAADTKLQYHKPGEANTSVASAVQWSPNHEITLSGLTPGVIYDYEVKSSDGSGEAIASGTFIATGAPGVLLMLSQTDTGWASYSDYVARKLTVDFDIMNSGIESAVSADVIRASAGAAIRASIVNPQLGQIGPGESRNLQVIYEVPAAVTKFRTDIYVKAIDTAGAEKYFPEQPDSY